MANRRGQFDPLQPATTRRWLVVRDRYKALIEQRCLEPAADLKAAMVQALAEHVKAGWQLEEFSSQSACAFCRRGEERRQISIEQLDPAADPRFRQVRGFK